MLPAIQGARGFPVNIAWPLVWPGNASARPGPAELFACDLPGPRSVGAAPSPPPWPSAQQCLCPKNAAELAFFLFLCCCCADLFYTLLKHFAPKSSPAKRPQFFLLGPFVPGIEKARYLKSGVSASSPFRLTEGPAAGVHFSIVISLAYVL